MNKRAFGTVFEKRAESFLEAQGYLILERNFRCRMGEIDLIAMDREYLVFVEVKYRADGKGGGPLMAVNYPKQRTISKVAQYYLLTKRHTLDVPCRFDVVGITPKGVEHVRDAFPYRN